VNQQGSDPLCEYFTEERVCNWDAIKNFQAAHTNSTKQQWIFRGLNDPTFLLESTLDRELCDFGIYGGDRVKTERGLLRKFQRHCDLYLDHPPTKKARLEWLSLMRHYGAPTRLLDWTYSFFVALYFALERAKSSTECQQQGDEQPERTFSCTVFVLNMTSLERPFEQALISHFDNYHIDPGTVWRTDRYFLRPRTFRHVFWDCHPPVKAVAAITPFNLNQRLAIQQGVFLCPGDVTAPFYLNLQEMLKNEPSKDEVKSNFAKLRVDVTARERNTILLRLQEMNMNRATLFPGLEGFSGSLRTLLADSKHLLYDDPNA